MKKRSFFVFCIIALIMLTGHTVYRVMNSRSFQLLGDIIAKVNTNEKVVALTFDDGPTDRTDEVLKVLEEADIKATFFLVGQSIESKPEYAEKIVKAGHEVGNHTYSHKRMIFKPYSYIRGEVEKTDELIRKAGCQGEILFRPPNGKKLLLLPYYLSRNNRKTVMWNIEPDSFPEIASSSKRIAGYVKDNISPGSIILLHVMYENKESKSLEAIKDIAANLKSMGYEFKTVSELLEYEDK
ncbi:MAG: polysaccharide deacetylase family protein [Bacillota bacterium]